MVAQRKLHNEEEHGGDDKDGEEGSGQADIEEFRLATTPQLIPAATDDRNLRLHPVRFFPWVVNWKNAARLQPVVQKSKLRRLDLSHVGININNKLVTIYTNYSPVGNLYIYLDY